MACQSVRCKPRDGQELDIQQTPPRCCAGRPHSKGTTNIRRVSGVRRGIIPARRRKPAAKREIRKHCENCSGIKKKPSKWRAVKKLFSCNPESMFPVYLKIGHEIIFKHNNNLVGSVHLHLVGADATICRILTSNV